jgi:hypothetical protein
MYVLNGVSNQLMRLTISDPLMYPIVRFTFLRFEIHLWYIEIILILIHVYNKNTSSFHGQYSRCDLAENVLI